MRYRFKDVVIDSRTGLNPRKNFVLGNGENNYITIKDIYNGQINITDKTNKVDDDAIQIIKKRSRIKVGDVLFVSIGRIGETAIVTAKDDTWDVNESVFVFTINREIITAEYFCMLFQSDAVQKYLTGNSSGSTFKSIKMNQLEKMIFDLPPLTVQKEITAKLSRLKLICSLRTSELMHLDDLIKARFVELFGDPVSNSKGWETYQLDDCLKRIDNGKSFVCSDKPRIGSYPAVLRLSAATYGDYRPNENKALLDESQFVEGAEVHPGDLLFTRKNTPELVGMAAYVQETPEKLMMPDLIFRLVPNEKMNPVFLWQLINCKEFRSTIQGISGGSAKSMSNISKERLGKIRVICPPRVLQDELDRFIAQVDKSKLLISVIIAFIQSRNLQHRFYLRLL